jgi:hypothetical protein
MTRRSLAVLAVLSVVTGGLVAWFWLGRSSPPQLPANEEVFKSVDALFTAITARDAQQLAACEARLAAHKERQELPPAAATRLDQIVTQASGGKWEASARALYHFIQGQKRGGELVAPRPKQAAKPAPR